MITTRKEIFNKRNVAFVINGCLNCRVLKQFLDRFNMNLELKDKIKIVDCTRFQDFGIIDDPLINEYKNYIQGYPTLFLGKQKIEGANTVEEYKVFLSVWFENKLILPVNNSEYTFDADCMIKKTLFGRKIICQ